MPSELQPNLEALAFLLGTWRGEGESTYPTMDEPVPYGEEIVFEDVGEPYLVYTQRSWAASDGAPIHLERGFLRPTGDGRVDLALAHPIGVTEIAEGRVDGTSVELASTTVARASTGDAVTGLVRRYRVDGDVLRYELDMAMEETPIARHLAGELRRVG